MSNSKYFGTTLRKNDTDIGNGQIAHKASDEEFDAELSIELNKRADKINDKTIDLANRTIEARRFLDWHTRHVKTAWLDWLKESESILDQIRMARVATGMESKKLLEECSEVRKFFICDQHEKEIQKLKEFIELCERLRALKSDGTLDKVADTILRLA